MNSKKKILLTLIFLFPIVMNSCISIDRNIKINRDGTGNETIKIIFSKDFYAIMASMSSLMDSVRREGFLDSLYSNEIFVNKTKEGYDSIPGIKIIDITSEQGLDSSNIFVIKYEFDSVNRIGSSLDKLGDSEDESETTVTWLEDGDNVNFNYVYQEISEQPRDSNDSLSNQMKTGIADMFKGDAISIQIEFPFDVVSSNSNSTDGRILKWNFPLTDVIMSGRMSLDAKLKK